MPWGFGPGDWGSLVGGPVTHLSFQLVQMVLAPIRGADDAVDGWPRGA